MSVIARRDFDVSKPSDGPAARGQAASGGLSPATLAAAHAFGSSSSSTTNALEPGGRLTILVPTRNEASNVEPLLARIERAVQGLDAEVLFVDDSDDDTGSRIAELGGSSRLPVRLHARPPGERPGGLGGAVVAGLELARGQWVCVMDGDLQHPPELITELLARMESTGADIVVASRLASGGSVGALSPVRSLASRTFAVLTRTLFLDRLAGVSDPMTGYFLIRRDAVDRQSLQPDGFKILLEILVRTPDLRVEEVPFHFGARHAEQSKAGAREVLRLARSLVRLSIGSNRRLTRFLLVGATGFVVNNAVMALLTEAAGLYYLLSAVVATGVTTLWNFSLTERWVFADRSRSEVRTRRLGAYTLVSVAGLVARAPLLFLLTSVLGLHYLISNVLTIGALTGFRYALAARWIWRPHPTDDRRRSRGGDHEKASRSTGES
jgi:dolichol-phosphate mannosyltransferase